LFEKFRGGNCSVAPLVAGLVAAASKIWRLSYKITATHMSTRPAWETCSTSPAAFWLNFPPIGRISRLLNETTPTKIKISLFWEKWRERTNLQTQTRLWEAKVSYYAIYFSLTLALINQQY